ncbi:MAG: hypothetical protein WKG07_27160 [Hymenobacter sp.]
MPMLFGVAKCKQLIDEFRSEIRISRIAQYEAGKELHVTPRHYLAERLNHSSQIARLDLQKAVEYKAGQYLYPKEVGDLLGSIDYFRQCLQEFHEAENARTYHATRIPARSQRARLPVCPLLLNYSLTALTALLSELGLLDAATGRPTLAARPGAWVGVVHGLLNAPLPRLRNNMAAIRRALVDVFGAQVSESLLQAGVSKRGSESEQFRDRTLALLAAPAAGD